MNFILSRVPNLPIKEAESKRKLFELPFICFAGAAHSWKSEGPYYLPNPSLRGTVDRKAPSKPPHSSKREGKGPMYLHDPCRFNPIYTRSPSPSGPATTSQNGSSCGTFSFWRNGGKILRPPNIDRGRRYGKLGQNMTPEGPGTHNPILSESEFTP